MNKKNVLIIGYGSIGRRHAEILKKSKIIDKIYIFTSQNCNTYEKISNLSEIDAFICSDEYYSNLTDPEVQIKQKSLFFSSGNDFGFWYFRSSIIEPNTLNALIDALATLLTFSTNITFTLLSIELRQFISVFLSVRKVTITTVKLDKLFIIIKDIYTLYLNIIITSNEKYYCNWRPRFYWK